MLRIEHRRVARAHAEERGIELVDVVERRRGPHVGRIADVLGRLAGGEQLLLGEELDRLDAVAEVRPERRAGRRAPGTRPAMPMIAMRDRRGRRRSLAPALCDRVARATAISIAARRITSADAHLAHWARGDRSFTVAQCQIRQRVDAYAPHPGAAGDALPLSRGHERRCRHRAVRRRRCAEEIDLEDDAIARGRGSPTATRSCARASAGRTATNRCRRSCERRGPAHRARPPRPLRPPPRTDRLAEFLVADRRAGLRLDAAPLWRLTLFLLGPDRQQLVFTYHHALLDTSVVWITEEAFGPTTPSGAARSPSSTSGVPTGSTSCGCTSTSTLTGSRPQAYYAELLEGFDDADPTWRPANAPTGALVTTPPWVRRQSGSVCPTTSATGSMTCVAVSAPHRPGASSRRRGRSCSPRSPGATDVVFGSTRGCRRSALPGQRAHHGAVHQHPARAGQARPGDDVVGLLASVRAPAGRDAGPRAHRRSSDIQAIAETRRRRAVRHHRRRQRTAPGHPTEDARRRVRHARLRPARPDQLPADAARLPRPAGPLQALVRPRGASPTRRSKRVAGPAGRDARRRSSTTPTIRSPLSRGCPPPSRRLMRSGTPARRRPYPSDACVHQLFEAQVDRTPDATALVYRDSSADVSRARRAGQRGRRALEAAGRRTRTRWSASSSIARSR